MSISASEPSQSDSVITDDFKAFLGEMEKIFPIPADEWGGADDEDAYDRSIAITFPMEVAKIHGASDLHVSIRNILTWAAAANEDDREALLAIRDNFYIGDDGDDYECSLHTLCGPFTPEDEARARAAHRERLAKRLARRAELEAEHHAYEAKGTPEEETFPEEKIAFDAAREELWKRADAIDAEWDAFVARWPSPDPSNEEEAAERAALIAKGKVLGKEQDALTDAWYDLICGSSSTPS